MINYFIKIGRNGNYLIDWPTNNILKRTTKDFRYKTGKRYAGIENFKNSATKEKIKLINKGKCDDVNAFKVSIIIPAYNAEKFIQETIDACYKQTHKNIEIIVVDDESTDRTTEIVMQNENTILLQQKNSGPGIARNFGVAQASGDFIFFLDADDYIPEYSIEALLLCCHNLNADFSVGKTLRKHLDQNHMAYFWMPQNYTEFRVTNLSKEINLFKDTNVHNRMYRSSFWKKNNFTFENCLYEDKLLSFDIWNKAETIAILDNFTYQWNVRGLGSSITNSKDLKNISNRMYVINKLLDKQVAEPIHQELEKFTIDQDLVVCIENWSLLELETREYIFSEFQKIIKKFEYEQKFENEKINTVVKNIKDNDFIRLDEFLRLNN